MTRGSFDIIAVTDPRFSGGTASSLINDVTTFSRLGMSVGLVYVRSHFFDAAPDQPNARVLDLPELPGVHRVEGPATADFALLHHPLAFHHGVHEGIELRATRCALVAHHPPFRGDGSLEYNPLLVERHILRDFGCRPWWAPVSGTVRAQLRSFAPFLTLTSADWMNGFDEAEWRARRPAFSEQHAVVGRHGRSDVLKWPSQIEAIVGPLSPGDGWRTRVMGCPPEIVERLGAEARSWEIVAFNAEPVQTFLESLDAFCYFYHPRWVEAFGRTVAEAILMERPCVLDPRLRASFGGLAHYCQPDEAAACLERLRAAPVATRRAAAQAREAAITQFGNDSIAIRLGALRQDPGTRSRLGPKSASGLATLRKIVGLARRERSRTVPV